MPRTMGTNDDETGASRSKRSRLETVEEVLLPQVHHEFLLWEGCSRDAKSSYNTRSAQLLPRHIYSPCIVNWDMLNRMGYDGEIDDMLRIRAPKWICECSLDDCKMDEEERSWDSKRESNFPWDLDTTTLRDLIDSDGKLIPEDPQPGVPRDAIERMEYRQSYHWDKYHGVFEHMTGVYSVPLQGAYNPPGYAQPQYDQYYQQYPPPPPQQQQDDDE
ncbi:hypothetical protein Tco_1437620 [Tanacetum coccineum]